jgi:KaiC/GvpD/RAD55 family RecA-like ATPase
LIPPRIDETIGFDYFARQAAIVVEQRRQCAIDRRVHPVAQAQEIIAHRHEFTVELGARASISVGEASLHLG